MIFLHFLPKVSPKVSFLLNCINLYEYIFIYSCNYFIIIIISLVKTLNCVSIYFIIIESGIIQSDPNQASSTLIYRIATKYKTDMNYLEHFEHSKSVLEFL